MLACSTSTPRTCCSNLPDAVMAPSLGAPELHSTGAKIAELPSAGVGKHASFARWLIPLVLIACIVGAATYEWYRGGLATLGDAPRAGAPASAPDAKNNSSATTALRNPLANEGAPTTSAVAPATLPAIVDDKPPATTTAAATEPTAAVSEAPATEPPILLSYSGPSWTEIRDRSGQLLISRLVSAHSVEPVRGTPPFDVVIGNASAVTLDLSRQAGRPRAVHAARRRATEPAMSMCGSTCDHAAAHAPGAGRRHRHRRRRADRRAVDDQHRHGRRRRRRSRRSRALADAGSELVRITVNTAEAAAAVSAIREQLDAVGCAVPLIGDFHFNGHKLLTAVSRMRAGAGQVPHQSGQRRQGQQARLAVRDHDRAGAEVRTSRCASASTGAVSTRTCWRA